MQVVMPSKYIQEAGAIKQIGKHFEGWLKEGSVVLLDRFSYENFLPLVKQTLEEQGISYIAVLFEGECCAEQITALSEKVGSSGARCVVGVGGGKVLDVAKAVGHYSKVRTIMVPTAASTDGACSKIAVLYHGDGTFSHYLRLGRNPDGVLVDSELIAKAPRRLLVAGIGDALSTYYETMSAHTGELATCMCINGQAATTIPLLAKAAAKQCLETMFQDGEAAVKAVDEQKVTPALERVVEGIVLLSCIGFENGMLGIAHDFANALSSDTRYHGFLHGEKVALGTIVQLEKEGWEAEEQVRLRHFCKQIGLPHKIECLGMTQEDTATILQDIAR